MRRFRSRSRRTPDAVRPRGGRPVRRTRHVAGRADHRLPRPGGRRARPGRVAGDRGALRSLGTAADRDPPVPLRHPRRAGDPRDGADRRREPLGRRHVVPDARGSAAVRARPAGQARGLRHPGSRHPTGHVHRPAADARPVPVGTPVGRRVRPVRPGPTATGVRRARGAHRHPGDRGPDRHAGRGVRSERGRLADEEPVPDRRGVLHDAPVPRGRRPPPDPLAERRPHRRAR